METFAGLSVLCFILSKSCVTAPHNTVLHSFISLNRSVDRLVSYYNSHYSEMNFDGLFGVLILRNHMAHLLQAGNAVIDPSLQLMLDETKSGFIKPIRLIDSFLPVALRKLEDSDKSYFMKMGKLYKLPWTPVPTKPVYAINSKWLDSQSFAVYNETQSDDCLSEVLDMDATKNNCILSKKCMEAVSHRDLNGYQLLHQVIFVAVIQQHNCFSNFEAQLISRGLTVHSIESALCGAAYDEFNSMLVQHIPVVARDLVLEQILVCGSSGYLEFANFRLLDQILSWQQPSGCFSHDINPQVSDGSSQSFRKLQTEKVLPDGCLSHLTSVAAGALAVYLRMFLITSFDHNAYSQPVFVHKLLTNLIALRTPSIPVLKESGPSHLNVRIHETWVPSVSSDVLLGLSQSHGFPPFLTHPYAHRTRSLPTTISNSIEPNGWALLLVVGSATSFVLLGYGLYWQLAKCVFRRSRD